MDPESKQGISSIEEAIGKNGNGTMFHVSG